MEPFSALGTAAAAGGAGAAGAGAGTGILGGIGLSSLLKVAPMIMTAGSLLTKDKTLKDLLGVGSLVAGGADLLGGGFGGGKTIKDMTAQASGGPVTIPKGTPTGSIAPTLRPQPGLKLSDIAAMSNFTNLGGREQERQPIVQPAPITPPINTQQFSYEPTALEMLRRFYG